MMIFVLQPIQMIEPFVDLSIPMPDKNTEQISESRKSKTPKNVSECPKLLQEYLEKKDDMYVRLETDDKLSPPPDSLENCLKLFTSLDVLDEDNKFICDKCVEKKKEEVCM